MIVPVATQAPAMTLNKSERSIIDTNTAMGKACGHTVSRVLASVKGTAASAEFTEQIDLSCAGILHSSSSSKWVKLINSKFFGRKRIRKILHSVNPELA